MPGIVAMASECAAGQGCQQRERLGEVHNFRWKMDSIETKATTTLWNGNSNVLSDGDAAGR